MIALGALTCANGWPHGGLLLMALEQAAEAQAAADARGIIGRRCEDCALKRPCFGMAAEGRVRWCGGCAKAHGRVQATALNTTTLCSQRTFEHSAMARRQLAQCTAAFNCMQLGNTKIKAAIMNNRRLGVRMHDSCFH